MKLSKSIELIKNQIKNNEVLASMGIKKNTLCLEGPHGIGKTAIAEAIANDLNYKFTKVNLGAFEEVGDLTGFPIKQYSMTKEGDTANVAEASLKAHLMDGWKLVPGSEPVMGFAKPSWVPSEEDGPTVLVLDDYSRANQMIIQATMELLDKGECASWKLPQSTQVLLTTNPDNGEYSVSSMDGAQRTRFVTLKLEFDLEALLKHMEDVGVRDEFINFAKIYPEIFNKSPNNDNANSRTYMAFARSLQSTPDLYNSKTGLGTALMMSSAIFNGGDSKDNIVGRSFTSFIQRKLHLLIAPKDMIHQDFDKAIKKIGQDIGGTVKDTKNFNSAISSTLTLRLINYITNQLDNKANPAPICDRLIEIVNHPDQYLTSDLIYALVKKIMKTHAPKVKSIIRDPKLKAMLLG